MKAKQFTWVAVLRRIGAAPLLLGLLLALPTVVQAQYTHTSANNQVTITGYTLSLIHI